MADFKLIPCKKCKGAAELKEGYKAGYYVECKNGCCYTPVVPNKLTAVHCWNIKRVTVKEARVC